MPTARATGRGRIPRILMNGQAAAYSSRCRIGGSVTVSPSKIICKRYADGEPPFPSLPGNRQYSAYDANEFLRRLPGILSGKVFVQNVNRDSGIDLMQRLADRFAADGVDGGGNHHESCLGGLEQDLRVVNARSRHGIVTRAAQHLAQRSEE